MDTERTRALAVSRAGHDKGRLYLILEEKDGMCALTDGRIRTLDRPKKKKLFLLQVIFLLILYYGLLLIILFFLLLFPKKFLLKFYI